MSKLRSLQVPALAVGAFALTVLLGLGGGPAAALWQQSATATMTVTANGWPGPAITSLTCSNTPSQKESTLSVTVPQAPATLTYAAVQADGTYGTSYSVTTPIASTLTPGTITLTGTSQIVVDSGAATLLTVRVTATYTLDQTVASANYTLKLDSKSQKVYC
ncbi:hypothetical protein [Pseudarthrobacter sp. NBSH8]|uniref:hypothetical protein n=1 Tax=Pseudarthrobacter sp. NBSH8 TaxID=2596911 RepID=UPI0016239A73|nr:hypothetical protein [Pseudarthrobacter sp. NBSH8]QNE15557.1 hypothetical protein FYJ92_14815 [Pseudarthrobacter sp. NBSH8]